MSVFCPNIKSEAWLKHTELVGNDLNYLSWIGNKGFAIQYTSKGKVSSLYSDLVKEYKDENLITNAISNAANRPFEYRLRDNSSYGGDNYISQFYQSLPYLPTNGLGGILLWDNHLDPNVNNVMPPIGITNVGYAGNPYAGSDINRVS